jgi:hypothetical protein
MRSRAVVMAELLEPMEKEAAKERQLSGLKYGNESRCVNSPQREEGKSGDKAAKPVEMMRNEPWVKPTQGQGNQSRQSTGHRPTQRRYGPGPNPGLNHSGGEVHYRNMGP